MNTYSSQTSSSHPAGGREEAKSGAAKLFFERFSAAVTRISGRPVSFVTALLIVIVWACCGPVFHYSETWQLIINTGTTIITFLMVFLIQQAQNKDTVALHLKLNELIAANKKASNRLINVEDLTEDELINLKNFFVHLSGSEMSNKELYSQHSVDEAQLKETAGDLAGRLHKELEERKGMAPDDQEATS